MMKCFVLLAVAFLAVTSAQPTSYRQDGSYKSVGLNFGHDFVLPRIPGFDLQVSSIPVPIPTLRQEFLRVPLPALTYPLKIVHRY